MLRTWSRAALFVALCLGLAPANWNDTSTGIDLNKLPHFPLTKIRSGWLKDGARTKFDGITVPSASETSAKLCFAAAACSFLIRPLVQRPDDAGLLSFDSPDGSR